MCSEILQADWSIDLSLFLKSGKKNNSYDFDLFPVFALTSFVSLLRASTCHFGQPDNLSPAKGNNKNGDWETIIT